MFRKCASRVQVSSSASRPFEKQCSLAWDSSSKCKMVLQECVDLKLNFALAEDLLNDVGNFLLFFGGGGVTSHQVFILQDVRLLTRGLVYTTVVRITLLYDYEA